MSGGSLAGAAARDLPDQAGLADLARLAIALSQDAPDPPASCRRGCTACCHQPVPLSPAEAFYIAELLRWDPVLRRGAERTRRRALRDGLDAAAWLAARISCPALAGDGTCSIHPQRPLACREHLAASDPARCWRPDGIGVRLVEPSVRFRQALVDACARVMGTAPQTIPLHHALGWAHANRAWGSRRWRRSDLAAALGG